ncbi:TorF family putative porin [Sphingomonas sp. ID0503]|uniref:TorF family putative porin n=1 Tax=Sphingomonas sp. ID0503 TaxID=3399691 RepID=UPI003AFAC867
MRNSLIAASALSLVVLATPAFAQDAEPAAPFTITGTAALTTDYRFRGISQTNEKLAVQAGATIAHESGFYASFWGSSIDDYVYLDADAEVDLILGYSKTVDGFTLDGGVLYYLYASAAPGIRSDFFEPYASVKYTYGPVTGKLGAAYAPKQNALSLDGYASREDNLYVYGELSTTIPGTPIGISGHLGYSHGRSALTLGQKDYFDWNITGSYTYKNVTFGVSYVDTDFKKSSPYLFFPGLDTAPGYAKNGYDLVDPTILGSVTFAF